MDPMYSYLPERRVARAPAPWHFQDDEFSASYPAIYGLLACALHDGKPRQGASITVFADAGELKVVISDRQTEQSLFLTLDASKSLWEQCEAFVRGHSDEWRAKKVYRGNGR